MSLIRPELMRGLWRRREILAGAVVILLGLWAIAETFGILHWLGYAIAASGIGLALAGRQRLRLRPEAPALGAIEADEGRLTYWGPLDGGVVAVDGLVQVALDRRSDPPVWVLAQAGRPDLHIPVTADGQDALFDALAAVPGLDGAALMTALASRGSRRTVIWQRKGSVDSAPHSPQA